jgi:hypothetical protein
MPGTNNRDLTLTREGANVRVVVTYNAVFSAFERNLAGLGMTFIERIAVIGVDPPGSTTGTVLREFTAQVIPVTAGPGSLSVPRRREIVLTRLQLDEDSNPFVGPDFDADEIRGRIRIQASGFPPAVTPDAFTDQEVLSGVLQQLSAAAASASASD